MPNPPAGWYDDPAGNPSLERFWDGNQWTQQTRDIQADPAPPPPPPAAADPLPPVPQRDLPVSEPPEQPFSPAVTAAIPAAGSRLPGLDVEREIGGDSSPDRGDPDHVDESSPGLLGDDDPSSPPDRVPSGGELGDLAKTALLPADGPSPASPPSDEPPPPGSGSGSGSGQILDAPGSPPGPLGDITGLPSSGEIDVPQPPAPGPTLGDPPPPASGPGGPPGLGDVPGLGDPRPSEPGAPSAAPGSNRPPSLRDLNDAVSSAGASLDPAPPAPGPSDELPPAPAPPGDLPPAPGSPGAMPPAPGSDAMPPAPGSDAMPPAPGSGAVPPAPGEGFGVPSSLGDRPADGLPPAPGPGGGFPPAPGGGPGGDLPPAPGPGPGPSGGFPPAPAPGPGDGFPPAPPPAPGSGPGGDLPPAPGSGPGAPPAPGQGPGFGAGPGSGLPPAPGAPVDGFPPGPGPSDGLPPAPTGFLADDPGESTALDDLDTGLPSPPDAGDPPGSGLPPAPGADAGSPGLVPPAPGAPAPGPGPAPGTPGPGPSAGLGAAPGPGQAMGGFAGIRTELLSDQRYAEIGSSERVVRQNSRLLKVVLGEDVLARQGSMVAFQGSIDFDHESAGGAGKFVKKALTGEGLPLMRCTGQGELFLADAAHQVHIIHLDGAALTVNGRNILAFEPSLDWDIERLKGAGMAAGGMFNTRLEGHGWVAITTDGDPVVLKTDAPTFADMDAAVAWSATLTASLNRTIKAKALIGRGSGEAVQLSFEGQGIVLVQPSEGAVVPPHSH